MSSLPNLSGRQMKAVRQSQRRSAEDIASLMEMSRNTYLSLEKSDVVPISHVRSFVEAMQLTSDELYNLLQDLSVIQLQAEEKNEGFDPQNLEQIIMNDFRKNLNSKDASVLVYQNQNESLKQQLQDEKFSKLFLKSEYDKLEVKFDGLRSDVVDLKRWVENAITQKGEMIESNLQKALDTTLGVYSKQIGQTIKESEGGGLAGFMEQSGISGLISNPTFAATIAQLIGNAMNPTQNQVPNPINFGQNLNNFQGMSGIPDAENGQGQDTSGENNIGQ